MGELLGTPLPNPSGLQVWYYAIIVKKYCEQSGFMPGWNSQNGKYNKIQVGTKNVTKIFIENGYLLKGVVFIIKYSHIYVISDTIYGKMWIVHFQWLTIILFYSFCCLSSIKSKSTIVPLWLLK